MKIRSVRAELFALLPTNLTEFISDSVYCRDTTGNTFVFDLA